MASGWKRNQLDQGMNTKRKAISKAGNLYIRHRRITLNMSKRVHRIPNNAIRQTLQQSKQSLTGSTHKLSPFPRFTLILI